MKWLLDLFYPPLNHCYNCGKSIIFSEIAGLCPSCLEEIQFISACCLRCGRALPDKRKQIWKDEETAGELAGVKKRCNACQDKALFYDMARSIAVYDGLIRELILKYKYFHRLKLKEPLSQLLVIYFKKIYNNLLIDYIIPVPLHRDRIKERGFDQVLLLAEILAKRIKVPLLTKALIRVKNSPRLYNLTPAQRAQAIEGCFSVREGRALKGKSVLLLDDILTTGTTVNEAGNVLKEAGKVKKVYVLTLATGRTSLYC